jgi:ABC-type glycerol-3-phosphate transport system permease component
MSKFIKFLLSVAVIGFRLYVIFSVIWILYDYSNKKDEVMSHIAWYISALILDLYFVNLDNNLGPYIYNKKKDEEEFN